MSDDLLFPENHDEEDTPRFVEDSDSQADYWKPPTESSPKDDSSEVNPTFAPRGMRFEPESQESEPEPIESTPFEPTFLHQTASDENDIQETAFPAPSDSDVSEFLLDKSPEVLPAWLQQAADNETRFSLDENPAEISSPDPVFTDEPLDPLEADVQYFLEVTGIAQEEPQPGIPPEPPPPEIQSAFVNPAMARVASARPRHQKHEPGEIWLAIRAILIILAAAVVVAFIFNYWTPDSFLSDEFIANLQVVNSTQGPPTAVPSPLPTFELVQKIGIITGHSGPPLNPQFSVDPGAICDENFDGVPELTELDINTSVALRVASLLVEAGYQVEMLNEWDPRTTNYRASVLISIHTNTCENLGFGATGFNVKANEASPLIDRDNILVDCLVANYADHTGLSRHFGSPPDLQEYHVFREVSLDTPMVIIELGFMFADRQVLTQQPDAMAQGIFEGIQCFVKPSQFVPTQPAPSS